MYLNEEYQSKDRLVKVIELKIRVTPDTDMLDLVEDIKEGIKMKLPDIIIIQSQVKEPK